MTADEFAVLVRGAADPVVLLEGRRTIPPEDARRATLLARQLATRFPKLRFRSGNAEGADQAFCDGVAAVDGSRLQVVAPYATHRRHSRYADAAYDSPDSLGHVHEEALAAKTVQATPANRRLIELRREKSPLAAKAAYLIRDTMKVVGHAEGFPKPVAALFYIDPRDPFAGGTGHTIRVCMNEGVPCVFPRYWMEWLDP